MIGRPRRPESRGVPEGDIEVFFVGLRWPQHAKVSGYDAIARDLGVQVPLPISDRYASPRVSERGLRVLAARFADVATWMLARLKPKYSWYLLRAELAVLRHMLRHRAAVYHMLYGDTDLLLSGYFGRLTGNRVIASFHEGPDSLAGCEVRERVLRPLSGVVLLGSCQLAHFAQQELDVPLRVIPHPVDTDFFTPGDPESSREERIVLTVGGHARDHDTLARAFALVDEQVPAVRFIAVGANIGNKRGPLESPLVRHLAGLSDTALRDLYRAASVAVFAFDYAVANNSVLEALACGVPVVATDIGSVSEYVDPGSGVLVPPRDPEAMAAALVALLTDVDRRGAMRVAARSNAERFGLAPVCRQLGGMYADTVSGTSSVPGERLPRIRRWTSQEEVR